MMFIDLLGDDVAQLQDQDRYTWNTIQDQNWIFPYEQRSNESWIEQNNWMKQKSNKDEQRRINKSNNN
jgi:hypothetical protein